MVKLVFFFRRKPGMTPEEFRRHYETKHVPLAIRLLPYFKDYRRNYIRHDESYRPRGREATKQPDFDVVTEITFENRESFDRMMQALTEPTIHSQIIADEEHFMDRSAHQMFFVDEEVTPLPEHKEFV
jgi:uncharacterized protein (TIGR02118 family)